MTGVADIIHAVEQATEIVLPHSGLVQRTANDPAAPFEPDVLSELLALKNADRGAFEKLRAELKVAGCRVTALDDAIAGLGGGGNSGRPTQADTLIAIAEDADLFHAADGTAFAHIEVETHRETWPVRTKGFRRWLTRSYFEQCGGAPGSEAMQSAIGVIEARAHYGAPELEVHLRVGELDGRLYLDLADATWWAIEIDTEGWRMVERSPVRFRRTPGMQALPVPVAGGSIETLRGFLNVQSDADFVLVVAWLLTCLRNVGPYPVLVLSGEQGSAKSTFSAMLRSLIDPNTAPLRAPPREGRDLFVAANNGHILAFDNVSGLPPWLSDTICRLATGGGFAVRQLYTDQDEVLFVATRPIILNGIEDIVTRQDLADRAIFLSLAPIAEDRRRPESELWSSFRGARPQLLGVLLDAVVEGLRKLPTTRLDGLPRMADFALWSTACETALWRAGTFRSAYQGNRDEAVDNVIDADPVAAALRRLMSERPSWNGTATQLLGVLAEVAGDKVAGARGWPEAPNVLSGRIRRAAPFLRRVGIDIDYDKAGHSRTRTIRIGTRSSRAPERDGNSASASSALSAAILEARETADLRVAGPRTMNGNSADDDQQPIVRTDGAALGAADEADDEDADRPTLSNPTEKGVAAWEETL